MKNAIPFPMLLLAMICCFLIFMESSAIATDENVNQANVFNARGLEKFKDARYDEAVQCFDKAISLNPVDSSVWYNKGRALKSLPGGQNPLNCFDRAIQLKPDFAEAWLEKAYHYMQFGSYNKEYFDKAIRLKPDFAEAWLGKGSGLLMELENAGWAWSSDTSDVERARKHVNDSIGYFDKAITLEPKSAWAWKRKADCYFLIGKNKIGRKENRTYFEEAIRDYDRAWELQPEKMPASVWEYIGISYDAIGKYNKAIECFDKAEKLGWDVSRFARGNALMHRGDYREAIECFERIIEKDPWNEGIDALRKKGEALKALGQTGDSKKCFDKADDLYKKYH